MPNVYIEETVVVPLLTRMRLPRWVLLELASKVAGERANVAGHEPPNVAGFETWRWGTRFCREDKTLRDLEWLLCDRDQVEGIRNDALGIKLVVCNTDANTGTLRSPRNLAERGPASCRLIAKNSGQMKLGFARDDEPRNELWYFCSHFCDDFISIEISRPDLEIGGFVTSFSDRIIVAKPGEIPGVRKIIVPQDFADVPKPQVSRKIG
jgi:hypothetical protein